MGGQSWVHLLSVVATRRIVTRSEEEPKLPAGQTASVSVSALSRDWGDVRGGSRNRWVVCKVSSVTYGHELGGSFFLEPSLEDVQWGPSSFYLGCWAAGEGEGAS